MAVTEIWINLRGTVAADVDVALPRPFSQRVERRTISRESPVQSKRAINPIEYGAAAMNQIFGGIVISGQAARGLARIDRFGLPAWQVGV